MPSRTDWSPAGAARARAAVLTVAIAIITTVHLLVTVGTHREHVVHVLFRGLYLLPIIAGAVWFRLRGAVLAAVAISVAYLAHVAISWHHQPMENANQLAMSASSFSWAPPLESSPSARSGSGRGASSPSGGPSALPSSRGSPGSPVPSASATSTPARIASTSRASRSTWEYAWGSAASGSSCYASRRSCTMSTSSTSSSSRSGRTWPPRRSSRRSSEWRARCCRSQPRSRRPSSPSRPDSNS